jgi:hypothetical protein
MRLAGDRGKGTSINYLCADLPQKCGNLYGKGACIEFLEVPVSKTSGLPVNKLLR